MITSLHTAYVFTPLDSATPITGIACKNQQENGKFDPSNIVTPKNFTLKLCACNYVGEASHHTNFGFNRYIGGFSPNRRKCHFVTLWLSCPVLFSRSPAQVKPLNRFSRFRPMSQTTCFLVRRYLLGIGNQDDGWRHLWEICLKPPQMARNR